MARNLHTSISEIEDMEMDRFNAYADALNIVLRAENGSEQRKHEGRQTTGAQARVAFNEAVARHQAKEN